MLTIIVAATIALSLACIVLLKTRTTSPEQLSQPRPAILMMGVQIICGDCSGDTLQPVKTYLDQFGTCSQCGGRSYVLASAVAANSALVRAGRLKEARVAGIGRVLPFEVPSRSERVAV